MRAPLVAILISACGSAAAPEDAGSADASIAPRVELGTGTSGFVEIPDGGAELELVAGAQGGFHVDLTARIWDLAIDGARIRYEATPIGGAAPISVPTEIVLDGSRVVREGDHWLRAGDFLQLEIAGPEAIDGTELEVRVEVECVSGARAEDARRAIVVDRR